MCWTPSAGGVELRLVRGFAASRRHGAAHSLRFTEPAGSIGRRFACQLSFASRSHWRLRSRATRHIGVSRPRSMQGLESSNSSWAAAVVRVDRGVDKRMRCTDRAPRHQSHMQWRNGISPRRPSCRTTAPAEERSRHTKSAMSLLAGP